MMEEVSTAAVPTTPPRGSRHRHPRLRLATYINSAVTSYLNR